MKSARIHSLLIAILAIGTIQAEPINENQARNIAANFMASHALQPTSLNMAHKATLTAGATSSEKTAYYVFNASRGGYVIVAGDDRAPAVLGYSEKGTFDSQNLPESMQEMLEGYAVQIEALTMGGKPATQISSGPAIAPLMSSTWSQKSPYNMLLPIVNGSRAVVGCAATAMAQVMYYWKWPARPTTTIPEYTTASLGINMPALSPVNFEWDAMRDSYLSNDSNSNEALAAATLSKYCAQALEMDFKDGTSSATTSRSGWALYTYFGYKGSIHGLYRTNYTSQQWADNIYTELSAGRPVIYSGSKKSGGHAFVCDGYDGNGMFHINWGWNSQSNGYFLLNVLNPDLQGTGSASGAYGYIYSQAIIVGIEPGEGANVFALTSSDVTLDGITTSRTSSNYDFKATVSGRFRNITSQPMAVSFGWGLYQGETLKSVLYENYSANLRPGYYISSTSRVLSFGKGITSGTYRIVPIYSEYSANNWRPCVGADMNYIEVTINGNTCNATGHGTAGDPNFTVNDIIIEGSMNNGRPVNIGLSLTNNGDMQNRLLYMFVDGTFTATGYVGIGKGETAVIPYRFVPSEAGNYTLKFSFNEDGSAPIATHMITINAMPEANLTATVKVLNVTDEDGKIVTSDKFSVQFTITNEGTTTYSEDISVKLFKNTYGNTGTSIQAKNQALELAPGETRVLQFDMDNVIDGWRYFAGAYCYSLGEQVLLKKSSFYTIIFPTEPPFIPGDVNEDNEVNIADVTALIDYLLNVTSTINLAAADVNNDSEVNIADVTRLIDLLLNI